MTTIDEFLSQNRTRFEDELFELLRIPSVSADSARSEDVQRAASWLRDEFQRIGLASELVATEGNPVVCAETPPVEGRPVALVYGHYDVQPPEPLELWVSPPFEPERRDGNIYARGATDDKGQMLTHVKSVESWLATQGKLPLQVKFVIEGEEEVGSHSLPKFLADHRERLRCDVVVISDMSQFGPRQPAITYGLRGIAYYELRLRGPKQDLHSGTFGGAVTNPANVLPRLLGALIDAEGRIQVPGFYDDVLPLGENERRQLAALPFNEANFLRQVGVDGTWGEAGFTTLERRWARPSLDVNGLSSGYQGEGAKTVLPSQAVAKFSFRLVPEQDPQKITTALKAFLEVHLPAGIQMELLDFHGSPGFVVPLDSPFMTAAASAIEKGFGHSPVFIREGGSIPIVNNFKEILGADTLLLGWGLDDDNTHAPNEKFNIADFHRGIKASAYLWKELSRVVVE